MIHINIRATLKYKKQGARESVPTPSEKLPKLLLCGSDTSQAELVLAERVAGLPSFPDFGRIAVA